MSRTYRSLAILFALFLFTERPAPAQKLLAEGIRDLGDQISATATREQKRRIAILPLRELQGGGSVLGAFLSEELTTVLVQSGKFQIIERSQLDRILSELKLDRSGLIDAESAKKVGKISGADAILTGTITDLATYVGVNCRMIDGQTGQVQGAAQVKIVKDADVNKIMAMAIAEGNQADRNPPTPPGPSGSKKEVAVRQEANGISFELKGCAGAGSNVDCDFLVLSTETDQVIYLRARGSRLVDSEGNEVGASECRIGSATSREGNEARLAAGIAMKARVRFNGVPSASSLASVVEVQFSQGFAATSSVKFRDVTIQRH